MAPIVPKENGARRRRSFRGPASAPAVDAAAAEVEVVLALAGAHFLEVAGARVPALLAAAVGAVVVVAVGAVRITVMALDVGVAHQAAAAEVEVVLVLARADPLEVAGARV